MFWIIVSLDVPLVVIALCPVAPVPAADTCSVPLVSPVVVEAAAATAATNPVPTVPQAPSHAAEMCSHWSERQGRPNTSDRPTPIDPPAVVETAIEPMYLNALRPKNEVAERLPETTVIASVIGTPHTSQPETVSVVVAVVVPADSWMA